VTSHLAPVRSAAQLGKLRRLQRISDGDGFIRVAAIDHPENYLALFDSDLTRVTDEEVVVSKLELVAAMSAESTAVLLDPVWSFGQAVLSQAVPADDCRRLDDAIDVPWVLLSASATYEQFRAQVALAARAGACGFMAGRAIWGDAVGRYDEARRAEGARTAAARLRELHETLASEGRGWHRPVAPADTVELVPAGWFAG